MVMLRRCCKTSYLLDSRKWQLVVLELGRVVSDLLHFLQLPLPEGSQLLLLRWSQLLLLLWGLLIRCILLLVDLLVGGEGCRVDLLPLHCSSRVSAGSPS